MKILFIHQNFPGQFRHLAPAMVQQGHQVTAMTMQKLRTGTWQGVRLVSYTVTRGTAADIHPWVAETETKIIRAEACFRGCLLLRDQGLYPHMIIAHPGWGESLFVKDVWPDARLGIYCEFHYHAHGADIGFDPEFSVDDPAGICRVRMKNINNLMHFETADAGISPTRWQAATFPKRFQKKITIVHDGIDTQSLIPDPDVRLTLGNHTSLTRQNPVITFVSRDLEPYRGYHVFMRALPELLHCNPEARVLIIGGSGISYGSAPPEGTTWKEMFFQEVKDRLDSSRVHFLGRVPYRTYLAVLQLSTVHVYLTYPFVLSWSLLEAMSMGCCIVASNTPPLHETITHDMNGRLVDFFDLTGLVKEVTFLLNNPDKQKALGTNARKTAVTSYDLTDICLPAQIQWAEHLATL